MSSANRIIRIHGPYVSEKEIEKISSVLRAQGEPDYIDDITSVSNSSEDDSNISAGEGDELYNEAINIVKSEGKASTSFLQRKLQIGYNRAARIIDMMEEKGVVSKANHVGKREVFIKLRTIRVVIFFCLFLIFTHSSVNEKSKIINNLNNIDNIQFKFTQKTNEEYRKR